jgi:tetratricopeptide (TPR) repeat protein
MFQTVQNLLPYYVNRDDFRDPRHEDKIGQYLEQLAKLSEKIEGKTKHYDAELKSLGATFDEDVQAAQQSFTKGAHNQAFFYVEEVLATCFSCHASRSTESDSQFADITEKIDWSQVEPFMRPRFLTVSRQFDKALTEYENLILNRGLSIAEVLHYDPFLNYLVLAIRVKNDKARALKTLQKALKKPYPRILKNDLKVWSDSLKDIVESDKKTAKLERAEEFIEKGRSLAEYPRDQSGIVYHIEASRILKELLVTVEKSPTQAEVAYLLGLTELVIGSPFFGLQAQRYFETAIRKKPGSPVARRAFDLYEENLIFGYSGSSGLHLPASEKEKLEELRKKAQ